MTRSDVSPFIDRLPATVVRTPAPVTGHIEGADAELMRVDVALVQAGLARSRTHAAKLVAAERVTVDGRPVTRASTPVSRAAQLDVGGDSAVGAHEVDWVSRGAMKLDGALRAFERSDPPGVLIAGRRCLDAGASTGGFTEVLLRRGADHVEAVDVGHDQLAPSLRADPRVRDRPGVSVRGLTAEAVGGPADLLVADLSFISLTVVLPDLVALVEPAADLVIMVKPQFEVGRGAALRHGVVRDPAARRGAVEAVVERARELGWAPRAVVASALPGPAGNQEFFLWLVADGVGSSAGTSATDVGDRSRTLHGDRWTAALDAATGTAS